MKKQTESSENTARRGGRGGVKKGPDQRGHKLKGNGLGTVWKRLNGRWSWQVTLGYKPDGTRIARSGTEKDKNTAEKALARAVSDHSRGLLALPGKVTLAEYSARWLAHQKNLADTTRLAYQRELNLALEHLGKMNLRDVKPSHIRDTLSRLADRPVKRGLGKGGTMASRTLAHIRTRLRAVFREAVSDGLIPTNPTEAVKRVKVARTEHPGIALDFDQAARLHELGEALYAAGQARLWPAIFAAISIGLRRGEVMGLRWSDVDLERDLMRVRQNLTTPGGKLEMRATKTVSGSRDVLIPASLKSMLERQRIALTAECAASGIPVRDDGPIFATALGTYTHPDNLSRALASLIEWSDPECRIALKKQVSKKRHENPVTLEERMRAIPREHRPRLEAVVRAGKPLPVISPHDLRHTAGTLMLRRGMPIEVVSKTLGHADIALTYRVYRHVLESERREHVVDLFPSLPERHTASGPVN